MLAHLQHALAEFEALDEARRAGLAGSDRVRYDPEVLEALQADLLVALDLAAKSAAWDTGIIGTFWTTAARQAPSRGAWGLGGRVRTDDLQQRWRISIEAEGADGETE